MPQCALSVLKSSAYLYMHSFSNLLELLYSSGTSLLGLHSVQSLRAAGLARQQLAFSADSAIRQPLHVPRLKGLPAPSSMTWSLDCAHLLLPVDTG